ncbi:MAG: N-6 DNA methylase [bacterium]|nr:N-6 DNA methylase [bacterium]
MTGTVIKNKEESFEQLKNLVNAFEEQYTSLNSSKYNETQLRIDFLNPFLKCFGWDVDNEAKTSQYLRDVIQEESIDVAEKNTVTRKKPDYTLRIHGNRKLFVEAKRVSLDIENSKSAAFQVKRYGWNANLGISILINFDRLIVYDCRHIPDAEDEPQTARYKIFHYKEYITKFDKLYEMLSYDSVRAGFIDEYFSLTEKETTTFDEYFLKQIQGWRKKLAINILENSSALGEEDINFLIQRLLNRVIFLRICEDREIEKYETLKKISTYDELKKIFLGSDKRYNSELFNFIEDNHSLNIDLDNDLLIEIFNELYYPTSSYDFAVIEPNILSQIYERYLGSRIVITPENSIRIIEEPEVVASNGVVPTPKFIVDQVIEETIAPLFERTSPENMKNLKIADICCGSGTFLISLFDNLIEQYTSQVAGSGNIDPETAYKTYDGTWQLTLKTKQRILLQNIFGVDLNPYAVEVAKFSLLIKLIENENRDSIESFLNSYNNRVLPNLDDNIKCGNSLVDDTFFEFDRSALENDELLFEIRPFNWFHEFPFLKERSGFDAIIGNPPYVRIQNLVKYSSEEIKFYQGKNSPYVTGSRDNFDKYYLFIERAMELTNSSGFIGYIVPHKFFIVKGGKKLRAEIIKNSSLSRIIHFGVTQVFPGRSTYTAIIVLDKKPNEKLIFKRISQLNEEHIFSSAPVLEYNTAQYSDEPWIFLSKEASALFNKIRSAKSVPLKEIAEIPVGLQTSADKIYILTPAGETENTVLFEKEGKTWEIEKSILLPCMYDLQFKLFDTPEPNALIIFPYSTSEGKAEIYPEKTMQAEFPLCWNYLLHNKEKLEKRSINGTKEITWYQYGRSQSLTRFHNTEKIIWPVLSTGAGYAYDPSNLQFTGGGNGPYYALISNSGYSLYYLIAILAHPVCEALVKSGASEFRGAYYSHGKQFIENLPIPALNRDLEKEGEIYRAIVNNTREIIDTKKAMSTIHLENKKNVLKRKCAHLANETTELINSLYGISMKDLESIEGEKLFIAGITGSSEL